MRREDVETEVRQEIEDGAPYSVEGLRTLLRDWEGTWRRAFGDREAVDFATTEALDAAAREVEATTNVELSDEDRQELVRYWFYALELRELQHLAREAREHLGHS